MSANKYKRILLKISGEALSGGKPTALDPQTIDRVVDQLVRVFHDGLDVAIIVGGGNFWRGRQGTNMDRATADQMGMLATIMNALALQDAIEAKGVQTRVQTAISVPSVAEPYILRKALSHFEHRRIVIFACGTGSPFFTTDTGAALRACEIGADVVLMAKNIDGVYDSDPRTNPDAVKFDHLNYMDVITRGLSLMDTTSITMCMDNNIPIIAFGLDEPDSIVRATRGERIGTLID